MVLHREKKVISGESLQIAFRVSSKKEDQFNKVKKLIEDVYILLKRSQKDDEKTIPKGEIVLEALEIGLKCLKKDIKN